MAFPSPTYKMQIKNNQIIIILCEGNSEYAYIQELNRFLREEEKNVVLIAKTIGSGHYADVKRKFSAEKKTIAEVKL